MIDIETAKQLMDQGELNKALNEAENYVDKCIRQCAATKGFINIILYDGKDDNTLYSEYPDLTLGGIIEEHKLSTEHIEVFHDKLLEKYKEAGYKTTYEYEDVGMGTYRCVFRIMGIKE